MNAARRGPSGVSQAIIAEQRDRQKSYTSKRGCARSSVIGQVDCYDGLRFTGSIRQQGGKYIAYDQDGHKLGRFDRKGEATSDIWTAGARA